MHYKTLRLTLNLWLVITGCLIGFIGLFTGLTYMNHMFHHVAKHSGITMILVFFAIHITLVSILWHAFNS